MPETNQQVFLLCLTYLQNVIIIGAMLRELSSLKQTDLLQNHRAKLRPHFVRYISNISIMFTTEQLAPVPSTSQVTYILHSHVPNSGMFKKPPLLQPPSFA